MKDVLLMMLVFIAFAVGFVMGIDMESKGRESLCESTVVTAIMEGKPFMFLHGRPVVVQKTVRQDRSVRYRAIMEADASDDRRGGY